MSIPDAPTLTEIVTEALKKAGYSDPSSDLITRASDYWAEEVKNDIYIRGRRLRSLQYTVTGVLTEGQSRYAMPTDFGTDLTLVLLDGSKSGTSQDGTAVSLQLEASESITEDWIVGKEILITSGAAKGAISQVTSFSESTNTAYVTPSFTIAPSGGENYLIVDTYKALQARPLWEYDNESYPTTQGTPKYFYPMGDEDYGEFLVYPVPDDTYGVKMRYYANLMRLDIDGTHMSTLYRKWRNLWVQGIYVKALQDIDDDRYVEEFKIYRDLLNTVIRTETYGANLPSIRIKVKE